MKTRTLALATGLLAGLPLVGAAQGGGPLDTRFSEQGSFRLDLAPDNVVPTDDGKLALAGGRTYGETGGTPRSDFDLVVARIVVDPALFADGVESGDRSAWAP